MELISIALFNTLNNLRFRLYSDFIEFSKSYQGFLAFIGFSRRQYIKRLAMSICKIYTHLMAEIIIKSIYNTIQLTPLKYMKYMKTGKYIFLTFAK